EGALVSVTLHGPDPARIDHTRTEDARRFFTQRSRSYRVDGGGVADVGFGVLAGQRPDGGDHPAVVLEVVVGIGDIVLSGVNVLGGHRDAAVIGAHVIGGGHSVHIASVGVAAPLGVHLREVPVAVPVARFDELQNAGTVRAGRRTVNPGGRATLITVFGQIGACVGPHEIVL